LRSDSHTACRLANSACQRIDDDQVAMADRPRRRGFRIARIRRSRFRFGRPGVRRSRRLSRRLHAEARDHLFDAVFEHPEIALLQVADVVARLIEHDDGHQHLPHIHAEHRCRPGGRLGRRGARQDVQPLLPDLVPGREFDGAGATPRPLPADRRPRPAPSRDSRAPPRRRVPGALSRGSPPPRPPPPLVPSAACLAGCARRGCRPWRSGPHAPPSRRRPRRPPRRSARAR